MSFKERLEKNVGQEVTVLYTPLSAEPAEFEGRIVSIQPSKLNLVDKILRREPVDIVVDSHLFGRIRIKKVTLGNLGSVLDPCTLQGFSSKI